VKVIANTSTIRVRYAETDAMGVAYYANYFVWFEVARTDLLRSLGWSYREMEESGVVLPVIEATCAYRSPARYDDLLEIRTEGRMTSGVRMEFTYDVALPAGSRVLASGRTAHAAVTKAGRPCRLPARITGAFA
jgi:acyl-CoA thioester hydrolase